MPKTSVSYTYEQEVLAAQARQIQFLAQELQSRGGRIKRTHNWGLEVTYNGKDFELGFETPSRTLLRVTQVNGLKPQAKIFRGQAKSIERALELMW